MSQSIFFQLGALKLAGLPCTGQAADTFPIPKLYVHALPTKLFSKLT